MKQWHGWHLGPIRDDSTRIGVQIMRDWRDDRRLWFIDIYLGRHALSWRAYAVEDWGR